VATRASAKFNNVDSNLFSTVLECCRKKAEIKYIDDGKCHIAGKSVFGGRTNKDGINFQIIFSDDKSSMEIYDYSKRGTDRRFIDSMTELLAPLFGDNIQMKLEDLNECGVCRKKLRVGSGKFVPSVGWGTCQELCESCYTLLSDHEKNYCCACHSKLGFRKYAARINWNSNLLLCKDCYVITKQNSTEDVRISTRTRSQLSNFKGMSNVDFQEQDLRKVMSRSVLAGADDPVHILKIRFARGEINKEEYQEMRKLLEE
jgi:hypothetical protein